MPEGYPDREPVPKAAKCRCCRKAPRTSSRLHDQRHDQGSCQARFWDLFVGIWELKSVYTVTLNPSLDKTLSIPRLVHGELNRVQLVRLDTGGKGINVSRALRALGVPGVAVGIVAGGTGQALAQGLSELRIPAELVWIPGETRSNITLVETEDNVYTKINEPGPELTTAGIAELQNRIGRLLQPEDLWVFSGSLPPGAPPDLYARLVQQVQEGGAYAALDSSGVGLKYGCHAAPFILKPNVDEAARVLGRALPRRDDQVDAVRTLLSMGVRIVGLTRGADGALVGQGEVVVEVVPPPVTVRSPIGAGDAFLAGLVYAWMRGLALEEMARWAVAAGTAATMQEGTGVGTRTQVEALLPQIVVRKEKFL
ncbi:MAG TPA: 1-phosphofructokinase [Anaerolineae bacterium]|nr:1-phosphofructokinase [Anaerolineae bacterium]